MISNSLNRASQSQFAAKIWKKAGTLTFSQLKTVRLAGILAIDLKTVHFYHIRTEGAHIFQSKSG
jgi:hypothetical protein